jgi:hypothetical protein
MYTSLRKIASKRKTDAINVRWMHSKILTVNNMFMLLTVLVILFLSEVSFLTMRVLSCLRAFIFLNMHAYLIIYSHSCTHAQLCVRMCKRLSYSHILCTHNTHTYTFTPTQTHTQTCAHTNAATMAFANSPMMAMRSGLQRASVSARSWRQQTRQLSNLRLAKGSISALYQVCIHVYVCVDVYACVRA